MVGCASELLGHTGSLVVDLRTREVGQQDRRNAGGKGLLRIELTCSGGSREIPTRARPELGNGGSSMIWGPKAEIYSGLQWRRWGVAEESWRRGALIWAETRAAMLGFGGGCGMGKRGAGRVGRLKGRAGDHGAG